MREMKDSGIEWVGEIPEEWTKDKVIRLFNIIGSGTTPKNITSDFPCVNWIQSGDINGSLISDCKNNISKSIVSQYSALKIYAAPFIVIAMYGASVGNISISLINGCVNQACCVLSTSICNLNYAFYAIKSSQNYLVRKAIGGGQPNINQDTIKQLWLPLPALPEQERIAAFLDAECAEIDAVLEKTRASIEEYKKLKQAVITQAVTKGVCGDRPMKDSGIEWIGDIPAEWEVVPFSKFARVSANLVNPSDYQDYLQVSPENIEKDSGKLLPCKTVSEVGVESWNHLFHKGQILYSKIRPKLNKVCIAPFDGLCSADMYPIDTDNVSKFVVYTMLSNDFYQQVAMITENRVKMPKINQKELSKLIVVLPANRMEQQEIVDYLDDKCGRIDALIVKKQQYLTEIENYKKSLIYEYVTGKKEVHPL